LPPSPLHPFTLLPLSTMTMTTSTRPLNIHRTNLDTSSPADDSGRGSNAGGSTEVEAADKTATTPLDTEALWAQIRREEARHASIAPSAQTLDRPHQGAATAQATTEAAAAQPLFFEFLTDSLSERGEITAPLLRGMGLFGLVMMTIGLLSATTVAVPAVGAAIAFIGLSLSCA